MPPVTDLADIVERTPVLRLATERRIGGEAVTPIWGVVVGGVPYVRSGGGAQSVWFQRIHRTGRAALLDGDMRYPVAVEDLDDDDVNRAVDAAYEEKYAGEGQALREVVSPEVRRCTMRLTPL